MYLINCPKVKFSVKLAFFSYKITLTKICELVEDQTFTFRINNTNFMLV